MAPQASKKCGLLPPITIISVPAQATASVRKRFLTPFPRLPKARVEAIDGSPDILWLRNVRITATGTCVDNAHIYFWAAFQAPPDTTGGQIITIERKAIGSFVPATVGNWIAIEKGVSQSPVIPDPSDGVSGTWSYFPSPDVPPGTPPAADSHVVTCGTCGNFTKTTSRSWNTFTGARVLKGEISFKLENSGNKLEFNNTTKGVKIEFRTGAGEPPICPDGCLPPE